MIFDAFGGAWQCMARHLALEFQVWQIEGHRRFFWVEFCKISLEVLEIQKKRQQALMDLLPSQSTLTLAALTVFDNPGRLFNQQVSLTAFKVGSTVT